MTCLHVVNQAIFQRIHGDLVELRQVQGGLTRGVYMEDYACAEDLLAKFTPGYHSAEGDLGSRVFRCIQCVLATQLPVREFLPEERSICVTLPQFLSNLMFTEVFKKTAKEKTRQVVDRLSELVELFKGGEYASDYANLPST
eukprot:1339479-Amorphochlora_amoeboformis.AAC.1